MAETQSNAGKSEPVAIPGDVTRVSTIEMVSTGNEVIIAFGLSKVGHQVKDGTREIVAVTEPATAIAMSPQTAKDLSLLLAGVLERLETDFGPIKTPHMRTRDTSTK